jgi:spermidine/putrescine transport system ATP-binding protein
VVTSRNFAPGQPVKVLLRPEDLRLSPVGQGDPGLPFFHGTVTDAVYKGSTVDVAVVLDGGKTILATEFFNEDDETISIKAGDRVDVTWVEGWEVVLPHEPA